MLDWSTGKKKCGKGREGEGNRREQELEGRGGKGRDAKGREREGEGREGEGKRGKGKGKRIGKGLEGKGKQMQGGKGKARKSCSYLCVFVVHSSLERSLRLDRDPDKRSASSALAAAAILRFASERNYSVQVKKQAEAREEARGKKKEARRRGRSMNKKKQNEIFSLPCFLSDQVFLCRVMQLIDERAIPRIHYNNNPLKISENLTNFLEACRGI